MCNKGESNHDRPPLWQPHGCQPQDSGRRLDRNIRSGREGCENRTQRCRHTYSCLESGTAFSDSRQWRQPRRPNIPELPSPHQFHTPTQGIVRSISCGNPEPFGEQSHRRSVSLSNSSKMWPGCHTVLPVPPSQLAIHPRFAATLPSWGVPLMRLWPSTLDWP